MDVNLEELDQIIDSGMLAPLSGVAHSGRSGEAQMADDRENPRGVAADSQF
jgi:nitroreductase